MAIRTDSYERSMAEATRDSQRNIATTKQEGSRKLEEIKVKSERDKTKLAKDYDLQISNQKNHHEQELIELKKRYDIIKNTEIEPRINEQFKTKIGEC